MVTGWALINKKTPTFSAFAFLAFIIQGGKRAISLHYFASKTLRKTAKSFFKPHCPVNHTTGAQVEGKRDPNQILVLEWLNIHSHRGLIHLFPLFAVWLPPSSIEAPGADRLTFLSVGQGHIVAWSTRKWAKMVIFASIFKPIGTCYSHGVGPEGLIMSTRR